MWCDNPHKHRRVHVFPKYTTRAAGLLQGGGVSPAKSFSALSAPLAETEMRLAISTTVSTTQAKRKGQEHKHDSARARSTEREEKNGPQTRKSSKGGGFWERSWYQSGLRSSHTYTHIVRDVGHEHVEERQGYLEYVSLDDLKRLFPLPEEQARGRSRQGGRNTLVVGGAWYTDRVGQPKKASLMGPSIEPSRTKGTRGAIPVGYTAMPWRVSFVFIG